jgi:ribosomal protein S21
MYVEVKGDKQSDLERALQQFVKQVKRAELMEDLKKSKRLQKKSQDALRRRKREESKAQKKNNNNTF